MFTELALARCETLKPLANWRILDWRPGYEIGSYSVFSCWILQNTISTGLKLKHNIPHSHLMELISINCQLNVAKCRFIRWFHLNEVFSSALAWLYETFSSYKLPSRYLTFVSTVAYEILLISDTMKSPSLMLKWKSKFFFQLG